MIDNPELVISPFGANSRKLTSSTSAAGRRGRLSNIEQARMLFDALPIPALAVDSNDLVIAINAEGENLFQLSAQGFRHKRLSRVIPFSTDILDLIERARESGSPTRLDEAVLHGPNLPLRTVQAMVNPAPDLGPDVVVLCVIERTEAPLMAQAADRANTAEAMSQATQMLAHEIKNPLQGIRGAAQLLGRGEEGGRRELADLICAESDRIRRLVDDIERFGQSGERPRSPINVHIPLERARSVVEASFGGRVRIRCLYDPSLPDVPGDEDRMVQAFLNLIKNAAEAATETGSADPEIIISTNFRAGLRVPGPSAGPPLPIEVLVTDNGPGVPAKIRKSLFQPFITSKPYGVGLGLAVVAKIVAEHQGLIDCRSEPGATTFRVALPIWREETLR